MAQGWNPDALESIKRIITSRGSLLVPHIVIPDINHIDPKKLRNAGIECLCYDIDNTIALPGTHQVYEPVEQAFRDQVDAFYPNVYLVSNSAGTKDDKDYVKARRIEEKFGVPVLRHDEKKPAHMDLVAITGCDPYRTVMVGNKPMTDTVWINGMGGISIRVGGWTHKGENPIAALFTMMEVPFSDLLYAMGVRAPFNEYQDMVKDAIRL